MNGTLFLLLVLVLSQSDALRCNCGGLNPCEAGAVETCPIFNELCGTVVYTGGAFPNFFKGCMSATECNSLNNPGLSYANCCRQDLCN